MRVYIPRGLKYFDDGVRECPRSGFYNVRDDVATALIADGMAFAATDDNMACAWADGESTVRIVDIGAGESVALLSPRQRYDAVEHAVDSDSHDEIEHIENEGVGQ